MSLKPESIENEYVHSIYSVLATYQQKDTKSTSPRIWPRVRQFVDQRPDGSIILDVGCGEAKYTSTKCHIIGFDTCSEVLTTNLTKKKENVDLALADAIHIPIKDGSVDAILNVSVIHHLSTPARRKQAIQECARCLRVGGQMLLYAWAFEQPNGKFASQDILVPWNLHETQIAGRLPKVKFHMNTTKEQRIIAASIPITVLDNGSGQSKWYSNMLNKVTSLTEQIQLPYYLKRTSSQSSTSSSTTVTPTTTVTLPSAAPQFLPTPISVISGIKRWSPMLGRRLQSLLIPVEEQFADELAHTIMREGITEAMATLRDVTFYRFYHVFKENELSTLVESINDLKVIGSTFEHGNWCVLCEKMPPESYIRA